MARMDSVYAEGIPRAGHGNKIDMSRRNNGITCKDSGASEGEAPQDYSAELVEALFALPIITPVTLGKKLDMNYRTASRYLAELAKEKVLHESYIGNITSTPTGHC